MNEFINSEMDVMEMQEGIRVFRKDLPGDALASAKLVKAALENNWSEVEQLLSSGADPRICRWGDRYGVESALYFALCAGRFDMAEKLYAAGDRLDDLIVEDDKKIPAEALDFLSFAMRNGDNCFYDESRPLSECCRSSVFKQIEKLMPAASQDELNKSIFPTVIAWIHNFKNHKVYDLILEDLIDCGAKLSEEERKELLDTIDRRFYQMCPAPLRPAEEDIQYLIALIKRA